MGMAQWLRGSRGVEEEGIPSEEASGSDRGAGEGEIEVRFRCRRESMAGDLASVRKGF